MGVRRSDGSSKLQTFKSKGGGIGLTFLVVLPPPAALTAAADDDVLVAGEEEVASAAAAAVAAKPGEVTWASGVRGGIAGVEAAAEAAGEAAVVGGGDVLTDKSSGLSCSGSFMAF